MVICKYYQRGHCRYGGYCRFEHVGPAYPFYSDNSINKSFNYLNTSLAQIIAEEVLVAERGGQWPLSCYGPFKEQPCIPGFDDVCVEEVRWQMYQAQKSGTVDQAKLQYEQLRQAASAKRETFKNPTHETIAMLEALQSGSKSPSTFGSKPSFALATPQLGSTSSNPFGAKTFGTSTFGGGTFCSTTAATSSIFSRTTTAAASGNVFGGKPAFGGTSLFGNQVAPPVFGGSTTTSVFGGSNPSPFTASQTPSPFGATSQTFGASSSLFGGATTIQPVQPTTSPFGTRTSTSGSSIFGQPPPAFGAAPVFGASSAFGATSGSFSTQTTPFSSAQATPFNTTQATPFSTTQTTPFSPTSSVFGGNSAAATTNFNAMAPSFPSTQTSTFAPPAATSASIFSRSFTEPVAPPAFGAGSTFGTPSTTSSANVFTATVVTSPSGTAAGGMSTGPFGKSTTGAPTPSGCHANYSIENALTDDEKNTFLADKFILGKIPVKPPTIELR